MGTWDYLRTANGTVAHGIYNMQKQGEICMICLIEAIEFGPKVTRAVFYPHNIPLRIKTNTHLYICGYGNTSNKSPDWTKQLHYVSVYVAARSKEDLNHIIRLSSSINGTADGKDLNPTHLGMPVIDPITNNIVAMVLVEPNQPPMRAVLLSYHRKWMDSVRGINY